MKILAIDSSGLVASIAIVEDDTLLAEYTLNYKKTHSQTLLPMIDEVTRMIELELDTLDAIAVAGGPGSFTGLRIGSATAKGLGFVLDKPLIHIPTVDALAYNLAGSSTLVCPLMDARRNQVYTGIYEFHQGRLQRLMEPAAMDIMEVAEKLCALQRDVIFLGDGVPVYRHRLTEILLAELVQEGKKHSYAPAHLSRQRAGAVGMLALSYMREGKTQTAAEHRPDYFRLSQAERERAAKEQEQKEKPS